MRRNRTYREEMFIKAWKLNLCAGIPEYNKRFTMQQDFCNALAYYLWLCSANEPSSFAQADVTAARVDKSIRADHDRHLNRQIDKKASFEKIIGQAIPERVAKAIRSHFEDDQDRKIAGKPLAVGRMGVQAAGIAFVSVVSVAAEQLRNIFLREPPDGAFHTGLASADAFGLFAETQKARPDRKRN